ncbi:MAG TPA: hypothetical protein VGS11_10960 [Candidatus Bathyarchaeia archaeon]|nr:hypothetical protein [Candidatus Bathyarchaeia archaeon]
MKDFRRSDDDDREQHFVESLKGPIDLVKAQIFTIQITRRKKTWNVTLGPDNIANFDSDGRIQGFRRQIVVKYLLKRDGNHCMIRSPFCLMGDNPFENPMGATIDHIQLAPQGQDPDQHFRNLRLACSPCNAHYQKVQRLQWKSNLAVTGTLDREKIPRTHRHAKLSDLDKERASAEIKINLDIYPVFCRWLKDEIDEKQEITVDHAISGGAKYMRKKCGYGSVQSSRAYLKMETSEEGNFVIVEGMVRRREKKAKVVKEARIA